MKLSNKSLYNQAKAEIIKLIKNKYSFMEKLPSEQQLAEMMGISRNTVREALKSLENEGLIVSRHGVGTFVISSPNHIKHNIAVLNSTTEIIRNNGYEPGTSGVFYEIRKAPEKIQKQTQLSMEQEYLYIERIRTANGKPIAYVEDYLPMQDGLCEAFAEDEAAPIFPVLEKHGMQVSFSNCTIHAVISDNKIEKNLELAKTSGLLLLQQTHYSTKGNLVLYSDSYFLTNELEFSLVRKCAD